MSRCEHAILVNWHLNGNSECHRSTNRCCGTDCTPWPCAHVFRTVEIPAGRARGSRRLPHARAGSARPALFVDGNVFAREWSEERVRESGALFEWRGVGIWLVYDKKTDDLVGFCGFLEIPSIQEPQLVYAMFERFTGRGYATEMARASIAQARRQPGFATVFAAADEVNVASFRILEKLGFERIGDPAGKLRKHVPAQARL